MVRKRIEAQRCSTRFCSKACTDHAYKEQKRQEKKKTTEVASITAAHLKTILPLNDQAYLSVKEVSQLLNLTRCRVQTHLSGSAQSLSFIFPAYSIRRIDIEVMIEARPYKRKPRATAIIQTTGQNVTEFYTTQEIIEKFGVSNSWVFAQGKAHNIPKVQKKSKTLWSKTHCDRVFAVEQETPQKEEWISYTEVRAAYHLTHDQIYSYVKYHGLRKKKVGKYTYVLRSEIDAILKPPTLK